MKKHNKDVQNFWRYVEGCITCGEILTDIDDIKNTWGKLRLIWHIKQCYPRWFILSCMLNDLDIDKRRNR